MDTIVPLTRRRASGCQQRQRLPRARRADPNVNKENLRKPRRTDTLRHGRGVLWAHLQGSPHVKGRVIVKMTKEEEEKEGQRSHTQRKQSWTKPSEAVQGT